ncbi:MAG: hypothetical protein NEHIOOID_00335 [Holosporales bacterium]
MKILESIAFKIYAALASLAVLAVVSLGIVIFKSSSLIDDGSYIGNQILPKSMTLINMEVDLAELTGFMNAIPSMTDREFIQEQKLIFQSKSHDLKQKMNDFISKIGDFLPKNDQKMSEILVHFDDFEKRAMRIFELCEELELEKASTFLKEQFSPIAKSINDDLEKIELVILQEKDKIIESFDKHALTLKLILFISFALLIFAAIAFSLIMRKVLIKPLNQITQSVVTFSKGDIQSDTIVDYAKGEIANLKNAIQELKQNARIAFISQFSIRSIETPVAFLSPNGNVFRQNPAFIDYLRSNYAITLDLSAEHISEAQLHKIFKSSALLNIANIQERTEFNIEFAKHIIDIVATPVFTEDQILMGIFIELYDKTEEKKAENELKQIIDNVVRGDFSRYMETDSKKGFMRDISLRMNALIKELSEILESFSVVFANMAQGDLNTDLEGHYEGVFKTIQNDANKTMGILRNILKDIQNATNIINKNLFDLKSSSDDLMKRSEAQSTNLQETAAAIEQLTSTIKMNSEHSQSVAYIATETKFLASESESIVNDAISEMRGIMKTSKKIHKIISVIEEISFQTNLLALNASIEAARAGHAGVGFAVVASEVRKLAQDSAKASEEIKSIIDHSELQIQNGVGLIDKTGMVLSEIVEHATHVDSRVGEITHTSLEQSCGLDQINTAVSQLDSITQMNFHQVQENQRTVSTLEKLAKKLNQKTAFFRF